MVEVKFDGRLGNNLFQYVLGRMIASELGYQLNCPAIPGFPETQKAISGKVVEGNPLVMRGYDFDWKVVKAAAKENRKIFLHGYFQHIDYYLPHRQMIREWLRTDPQDIPWQATDDCLLISLRLGNHLDFGHPYRVLPLGLIRKIARSRDWKKILIVTEDPSQPFAKNLVKEFDAEIFHGSVMQDFAQTRNARNLLLSTSSFSWWAGFLSHAEKIWYPEIYNWSRKFVMFPYSKQTHEVLYSPAMTEMVKVPGAIRRSAEYLRYFVLYPKYWTRILKHILWRLKLIKR